MGIYFSNVDASYGPGVNPNDDTQSGLFITGDFQVANQKEILNRLSILFDGKYREGSLDIWGSKGRIEILQEGLNYKFSEIFPCRSLSGFSELNSEFTKFLETWYGDSMYYLYDEVAKKLKDSSKYISSPGSSALRN